MLCYTTSASKSLPELALLKIARVKRYRSSTVSSWLVNSRLVAYRPIGSCLFLQIFLAYFSFAYNCSLVVNSSMQYGVCQANKQANMGGKTYDGGNSLHEINLVPSSSSGSRSTVWQYLVFYTLFIVTIQYHYRKHVFHIIPHSTDVGTKVWFMGVEKPYYRRKTPLVVGGTRTWVLADSMVIVANHCTT